MEHTRAQDGKIYTLHPNVRWVMRDGEKVLQQFGTHDGVGVWIDVPVAVEFHAKVSRTDTLLAADVLYPRGLAKG
jgi:hypothetical protein